MAGRNDQRCSITAAARSASAWNAGSPVGTTASAYSTITAVRVPVVSSVSSAASVRSFAPGGSSSSGKATSWARLAKRTPVATL